MNTNSIFSRFCHIPILRLAAVILVALAWSNLAFCGEIHDAAKQGDLEKVKSLLNANPDLVFSKDSNGDTPLHLAADKGHKDVMELLLANKADYNVFDAAAIGDLGRVKALVNDNLDLVFGKDGEYGYTPLHFAVKNDHKDVVEFLLAIPSARTPSIQSQICKIEVNAKSDWDYNSYTRGYTPLHIAALNGHKDVAELLLANGAEVNVRGNNDETPLELAAKGGHMDMVELLLANKAEVNATNNYGWTPLHFAVNRHYNDVAELLSQHGGTNDLKPPPPPRHGLP
jgi:serine/threonine-protein phosphatase 6 regulatory ankyrin repeat subunit B